MTARDETLTPQRLNVSYLLALIDLLDNERSVAEDSVISAVGARNRDGIDEYRRFLLSGGLIQVENRTWTATKAVQNISIALRNEDVSALRSLLLAVPSYQLFSRRISETAVGAVWDPKEFKRSVTTYRTLGEITQICAPITGEGVYPTPAEPDLSSFVPIAVERFQSLAKGEDLVATGAWFEELIRKDGIHPAIARVRLNDASARKFLTRSTEGSTTDIRLDNHVIQVLRLQAGKPMIAAIHLYRGDYLIPGKSSTSLRIQESHS